MKSVQCSDFLGESNVSGEYYIYPQMLSWVYEGVFKDEDMEWLSISGAIFHFCSLDTGEVYSLSYSGFLRLNISGLVYISRCVGYDLYFVCKSCRVENGIVEVVGFEKGIDGVSVRGLLKSLVSSEKN